MYRPAHLSKLPLAIALSLAATGCVRSSDRYNGPPLYDEQESNDNATTANDFGILRPGDLFIIRGDISDIPCDPFDPYAYCDPFDGFAFTSGEPIYVEFRLFADRSSHDFDVCLYDPFLDLTIDCWQTPNDPEVGGIEVYAGGLDFHLVLESFYGTGGYELEIEVFGLYESGLEAPEANASASARPLAKRADSGSVDRSGADASHFEAYASGDGSEPGDLADDESVDEQVSVEINPLTGEITETVLRTKSD